MKTIQLQNIQMSYTDQGSGATVMLLHGFCGSSVYWEKVVPILSRKYRVITPDLRGHGQSAAPAGPYSMELMAEDIRQLLEALNISEFTLFGHSLGGYVTLAFAEKYPELLSAFSLIHSTARPDDTAAKEGRLKAIENIKANGVAPFIDTLIPKLFAPEHVETMSEAVEFAKIIGYNTPAVGAIQTLEGMKDRLDRNHVLRNAKVPVLLVAGDKDQIIPVSKTFSIERRHIKPIRIKNAGHMSMLEAPEQLAGIIEEFMTDSDTSSE